MEILCSLAMSRGRDMRKQPVNVALGRLHDLFILLSFRRNPILLNIRSKFRIQPNFHQNCR